MNVIFTAVPYSEKQLQSVLEVEPNAKIASEVFDLPPINITGNASVYAKKDKLLTIFVPFAQDILIF